jgi:hypothetical protein
MREIHDTGITPFKVLIDGHGQMGIPPAGCGHAILSTREERQQEDKE